MPYGLLASGFSTKPQAQIIIDMQAAQLAGVSASLNLTAPDPIAVITGIFSAAVAEVWQLVAAMYSGMDPDTATGDQLVGVALLTGTVKQLATATTVVCTITTDAAFSAALGTMFASVAGVPSVLFTNAAAFSTGMAGATTGVTFVAVVAGPTAVNASSLTVISSPLNHWTGITNPAAGVTGSAVQTDAQVRAARSQQLSAGGSTSAAAIQALVLKQLQPGMAPLTIAGIQIAFGGGVYNPFTPLLATLSCTVLWNDTDAVDGNGLPAHSIEVIASTATAAQDMDNYALCALILATKAAGINTYSGVSTSKVVTDAQGTNETISYTRPTILNTNITVNVKQATGKIVTQTQVKDAIFTFAQATLSDGTTAVPGAIPQFVAGGTVYASHIIAAAFVAGVADVSSVVLSAANVGVNIVPTVRQLVQILNAAAITVNIT